MSLRAIAAVYTLGLWALPAGAASYVATLLHPVDYDFSYAQGVSGTRQVGYGEDEGSERINALVWNGTAESATPLPPGDFGRTLAYGISGTNIVGSGSKLQVNGVYTTGHALLWPEISSNPIDLHPYASGTSVAHAAAENAQVGFANTGSVGALDHAYLWHGSAASGVDLHPAGYNYSAVRAVHGGSQVGEGGRPDRPGVRFPLLWHGTPESAINLAPEGMRGEANGVWGDSQVGLLISDVSGSNARATLWHGTPESAIDLHPEGMGFVASDAIDVVGNTQVGRGFFDGGGEHALVWNGTAESVVDLHQFLTGLGQSFVSSLAIGVSENGDIIGRVNDGVSGSSNYAVMWRLVPEPACSWSIAWFAATIASSRRRRRPWPGGRLF